MVVWGRVLRSISYLVLSQRMSFVPRCRPAAGPACEPLRSCCCTHARLAGAVSGRPGLPVGASRRVSVAAHVLPLQLCGHAVVASDIGVAVLAEARWPGKGLHKSGASDVVHMDAIQGLQRLGGVVSLWPAACVEPTRTAWWFVWVQAGHTFDTGSCPLVTCAVSLVPVCKPECFDLTRWRDVILQVWPTCNMGWLV